MFGITRILQNNELEKLRNELFILKREGDKEICHYHLAI